MNEFDVPMDEMNKIPASEADIEALLSDSTATAQSDLHALMLGLRTEFHIASDVPTRTALREFLDVVELTTTPSLAAEAPRRSKMIAGIAAFVATTTGKIVLGTAVAAASVGGVHAADIVDVPGLPTGPSIVEQNEAPLSEDPVETPSRSDEIDESDSNDKAESKGEIDEVSGEGDEDNGEQKENHGQVVSDFVHSTDLEGCEKGQAIAELASSKAAEHRKNPSDDEESKCKEKSAEDADGEAEHDDDNGDEDGGENEEVLETDEKANRGKSADKGAKGKSKNKNNSSDD